MPIHLTVDNYADYLNDSYYTEAEVQALINPTGVVRREFWRYYTSANQTGMYLHMRTDRNFTQSCMHMFEFEGYGYGATAVVDSKLGLYEYSANGGSIQHLAAVGADFPVSAYKSAVDNHLILTMQVSNTYYLGFVLSQIDAGPQGLGLVNILSAVMDPNPTGVY